MNNDLYSEKDYVEHAKLKYFNSACCFFGMIIQVWLAVTEVRQQESRRFSEKA